jgi:hypothetical protein
MMARSMTVRVANGVSLVVFEILPQAAFAQSRVGSCFSMKIISP